MAWVALGGAVGSASRFAAARGVQQLFGGTFPYGTMFVNVLGCITIGFLAERFSVTLIAPHYRLAVLVGLLGGFTTFSTFSQETLTLLQHKQNLQAAANVVGTVLACLAACWLGHKLAEGMAS